MGFLTNLLIFFHNIFKRIKDNDLNEQKTKSKNSLQKEKSTNIYSSGSNIKSTIILKRGDDIDVGIDYRYVEDESYIIRIKQMPPEGFNNLIAKDVMGSKISYASKVDNVISFITGYNRRVLLEFSRSGIKVIGQWQSIKKERTFHLCWVPKNIASYIRTTYPNKPLAATLKVMFLPRSVGGEITSPGIRYDIWVQS